MATVALKHGAVLQNGADVGRGVDLVGVRAHGHQALVHSHQCTLEHLERERARNVCRQAERLRVIDRKRRERGDGRGAGEQDKAFFGRKHDGLESRALERLCAVKRFALMGGPALADHHHADVALERQIADRAVAGDDGADARVEHVADQRERFKTDARVAGAEVAEHDEHHRARALLGDGLADGAGVGVDVVALDRLAVLFGDELLPVVTKARGQTIDGLALVTEAVDMGAAVVDALFIFFGKRDLRAKARDTDEVVDGGGAAKRNSVHIGSYLLKCGARSLTGSCRSCSRRPRWRCSAPFCPSPSRRRTRRSTGGRKDGIRPAHVSSIPNPTGRSTGTRTSALTAASARRFATSVRSTRTTTARCTTMWTSAGAAPSVRPVARSTLSTCCRESRRPERSTKALRNSILAGRYPKSGRPAFFLLCAGNGERKSAPWHLSKL